MHFEPDKVLAGKKGPAIVRVNFQKRAIKKGYKIMEGSSKVINGAVAVLLVH